MGNTAITTSPKPPSPPAPDLSLRTEPAGLWPLIKRVLAPVASLRLTVTLFALDAITSRYLKSPGPLVHT